MEKTIGYKFAGLELKEFATFEDDYNNDEQDIEISCRFTLAYNFAQNIVCCSNSISMKKEGIPLIKAALEAYFAIAPSSFEVITEDGYIVLP